MDTRQQFEQWITNDGDFQAAAARDGDGYRLMQSQQAWLAWSAAAMRERAACIRHCRMIAELHVAKADTLDDESEIAFRKAAAFGAENCAAIIHAR